MNKYKTLLSITICLLSLVGINSLEAHGDAKHSGKISPELVVEFESDLVLIPAGNFKMGSNKGDANEKPVHSVTITPFYLSRHQVMQRQWREVMGNNPSFFKGCDDCPVENVSWNDVQKFIKKLNEAGGNFRLPSEAEWEYACRGGNYLDRLCGGNGFDELSWHSNNSHSKTHPVGQKLPNSFGLYDMIGNVGDWVQDCWHDSYRGAPISNQAWTEDADCNIRMNRGGDFRTRMLMSKSFSSTYRTYNPITAHSFAIGFRLAKSK